MLPIYLRLERGHRYRTPLALLLGFLFAPWTTLMYVVVFPGGIDGFDWIWLGFGVAFDLFSYSGGAYSNRARIATYRS